MGYGGSGNFLELDKVWVLRVASFFLLIKLYTCIILQIISK